MTTQNPNSGHDIGLTRRSLLGAAPLGLAVIAAGLPQAAASAPQPDALSLAMFHWHEMLRYLDAAKPEGTVIDSVAAIGLASGRRPLAVIAPYPGKTAYTDQYFVLHETTMRWEVIQNEPLGRRA